MALEKINKPNDIKNLTDAELKVLPEEIRKFLIENISKTGGHLASNLGTVELTMALHLTMDFPKDKLIWDVGHQSYTHKILTGRKEGFSKLRKYNGMSGFPKRAESDCDSFDTGHSSTSIAAGLGYAFARDMNHERFKVVSVIGDGSLTGGLAWEALNTASSLKKNFIIVLNDNEMSINENVGAVATHLSGMRTSENYYEFKSGIQDFLEGIPVYGNRIADNLRRTKSSIKQLFLPGMVFEQLGILTLGPVDGHDVKAMVDILNQAYRWKGPVLIHVRTKKGMGYEPAEKHPARFHGTDPFDISNGLPIKHKGPGYTDIFSTVMRKLGDRNKDIVAITAAMADGTGLKRFHNMFPERFFDVGIAEDYAVTFAAALAINGKIPVFAVYSSFLQRAYDEILHDVCMQRLHVIFAIDRAGLVGADGETHQGVFDISYLSMMPNMTVMAPKNIWELSDMMKFAVDHDGPVAIRYPRGEAYSGLKEFRAPVSYGKCEEIYEGHESRVLLFALGSMVRIAEEVRNILSQEEIPVTLTNARFAKPFDKEYLDENTDRFDLIVTLEENVKAGGFGENVLSYLNETGYKGKFLNVSVPDRFVPHGSPDVLFEELSMDAASVSEKILDCLGALKE